MITEIHSGMGNQIFRWAFGRSVSLAKGEECLFKKYLLDRPGCRAYSLGCFNIDPVFTESEGYQTFEERTPNLYDPAVYTQPPNTYYRGNWQTERYFNIPVIRKELTFRSKMSDDTQRWAERILAESSSAFIHIRHSGDYALPEIQAIYGGLDKEYYEKAVQYIQERVGYTKFFIITDDVAWANSIHQLAGCPIISHGVGDGSTGPAHEYEDLWLMSLCNHAIIPSSSFGWWGAWLGDERQGRIVVTPANWYKILKREGSNDEYHSEHIIPDRWIRLKYE